MYGSIFTTNGPRKNKTPNSNITDDSHRETRSSTGLTGSPWTEYMPSKPGIPKLKKRTAKPKWDRIMLDATPKDGVCPVDDYLIEKTGIPPADLDKPPRSKDFNLNILSVMCLNIIAILAPDPQVHYYLPVSSELALHFTWVAQKTPQSRKPTAKIFGNQPTHSKESAISHVSIRFFNALARGCIPWRLLEIAASGLPDYLQTLGVIRLEKKKKGIGMVEEGEEDHESAVVHEIERKRYDRYELANLEKKLLEKVNLGELNQLTEEYDKFAQLVEEYKLNMHPEDERRMNYPNYRKLEKHAFVKDPGNFKKNETLWLPLRDYDGVIYLVKVDAKTSFMMNNKAKDFPIEELYAKMWDQLEFAKSSEGGHPPRHVNVGFTGDLKKWPFWIRILPAAEARFGKEKVEKLFAECIAGTNTSSGKYKIKLGLYDNNGKIIGALGDKSLPGVEPQIDPEDYVFLSENPFQLYQTWIHIECLSEYITKGAPRQLPNIENLQKPLDINVELDEEEEKVDVGKNTVKQKPKAAKKEIAKLPKTAAERKEEQEYSAKIYKDLYEARHTLGEALKQPSADISNAAAIEANGVIKKQMLKKNKYNDKIWNPLVLSISAAKVVATVGKRTGSGIKSQGSIMGSASQIAKYRFNWGSKDNYIIEEPMTVEGEQPKENDDEKEDNAADDKEAHLQSKNENEVEGEEESPDLKVNGGFHTFYIAEWLHLSAFSWGGFKMARQGQKPNDIDPADCKTSQIYWNLIFGTSETNSVMTRFERAWQDLFEDEAELFRNDQGSKKDFSGWLLIEKDPPGVKYIEENRNNSNGAMYKAEEPRGGDPQHMTFQAIYPWICYCLRYTIVIQGTSRILSRKNPSFTTHFYPFTRFFFHSAENSLDTRLFQFMKKQALSAEEIDDFTNNNNLYDKSPKFFWRPLFPGGKYEPNEVYVDTNPTQPSKLYKPANKQPVFQQLVRDTQNGAANPLISNNLSNSNQLSQNDRQKVPKKSLLTKNVSIKSLSRNFSMEDMGGDTGVAMGGLGGNLGGNPTGKSKDMDEETIVTGTRNLNIQESQSSFAIFRNVNPMDPLNFANTGNGSLGPTDIAQLSLLSFTGNSNPVLRQFQTRRQMGDTDDDAVNCEDLSTVKKFVTEETKRQPQPPAQNSQQDEEMGTSPTNGGDSTFY